MPAGCSTNNITANAIHQAVQKAQALLASSKGQQALTDTVRQAVRTTDHLRDAQRVDPKTLHEPVTL